MAISIAGAAWCVLDAAILRNPDLGGGETDAAELVIPSLMVTHPYPASRASLLVFAQAELESPRELKELYHVPSMAGPLPDVREGDIVILPDNRELTIAAVAEWPDWALPALIILAQEIKNA